MIDLHIHSTASDGTLTPKEIVDLAIEKNIPAIAICDHEVAHGSIQAKKYSKNKNIEVISGIEIGCDDKELNLFDIHIVGLYLDFKNKELNNLIKEMKKSRIKQKTKIIKKLNELGYDITFSELIKESDGGSFGRPHIARILLRKYPELKSVSNIFDKLLGENKPACVKQEKRTISEVIKIIKNANGIAILAHPGLYNNHEQVIEKFIQAGGHGIEVLYPYGNRPDKLKENSNNLTNTFSKLANKHNLLISGGTDFHTKDDPEIGSHGITLEEFEILKKIKSNN
ncbi:PHP domain-containing protein [Nanoarchaeota archaeon]